MPTLTLAAGCMNYRQIEVFHAVMETGSVTAAARLLNLTQPAVTKILRHAEDQLRFPLFDRVKGRLVPTPDALALFPNVQRVFDEVGSVRQAVEAIRTAQSGALNIVTIPTLGEAALPKAVAAFMEKRPTVRLTLEVRPRREVVQRIATQRADLGFAFLAQEHANVVATELCRGRIVCIMQAGDRLAAKDAVVPADLVGRRLVSYSREQGLRPMLDAALASARVEVEPVIEVGWVANAWALVSQGIGLALVDDFSQLGRLYPDVVSRPFRPEISIVAEVLHPRLRPLSRLAVEFVETARTVLNPG
jgi:DNA-binding transcriptional LysR family regulator